MDDDAAANPVVSWYDDQNDEGYRVKAQDVISKILQESESQYTAALEALGEREWHINGRMICGTAGVIRDSHLKSLEDHACSQTSILQWHANRAAGMWENECVAIMDKMGDVDFCRSCALTKEEAALVTPVNNEQELEEIIQKRAERLFNLCACLVSKRCWTMKRMSTCPPLLYAGAMHERGSVAKGTMEQAQTLNHALELAKECLEGEGCPPKLKELLSDLYYTTSVLCIELSELFEMGNWSYKDAATREQLWELFCGVAHTKKVLEDMFGRLKCITTMQNRNRRINLHRISLECSGAATLQDGNSGKMLKLEEEDYTTEIEPGVVDAMTDGIFNPQDHELEGNLQARIGFVCASLFYVLFIRCLVIGLVVLAS